MADRNLRVNSFAPRHSAPTDSKPRPVRVLIADDHPVVRDGLRCALSAPDIEVVGDVATAVDALISARNLRPDILILDIRMPGGNGLEILSSIKSSCPTTAVLIFTTYEDSGYLREAILGGAAGYILKASGTSEILMAVRRIAEGDSVLEMSTLLHVLERPRGTTEAEVEALHALRTLTRREMQVLQLIRAGLKNADIAQNLHVDIQTIKGHCSRLYRKIGVSDRTQAVLWAQKAGVAPFDEP